VHRDDGAGAEGGVVGRLGRECEMGTMGETRCGCDDDGVGWTLEDSHWRHHPLHAYQLQAAAIRSTHFPTGFLISTTSCFGQSCRFKCYRTVTNQMKRLRSQQ
jgi:hypothetical protein